MSTPVFIIAQQRSGTNLLRRSLATTGLFGDTDEVFDPRRKGFWPFYQQQVASRPELSRPTASHQIELFESFLESTLDNESPYTLLDVKYNSTHLQDGMWHSPIARPAFVNWLIRKQHPVIHLVRDNCLENYVSFLVGTHTQDWVVGASSEKPKPVRLRLESHHAVFQVKRRQRQIERFRNNLASANSIELRYESLIESEGHFSTAVANQISEFLGIDEPLSIEVPTKKIGRPLRDVVVNFYDEVAPAMKANGLGQYVQNELAASPKDADQRTKGGADSEPDTDDSIVEIWPFHILKYVSRKKFPPLNCQPVFVLSMQQSGSEPLCSGLSQSKSFHNFGEPFCPSENTFWQYRQDMLIAKPELAIKTAANQLEIFDSFLSSKLSQNSNNNSPFGLIDVKYNSTQHLNEAWYHRGTRPLLLEWLVENQFPVLHVIRQNVLASYFDNWVNQHASQPPVSLDTSRLLQHLKFHQMQINIFRQWLEPLNSVEINYESLLNESNSTNGASLKQIKAQLQIKSDIDISFKAYPAISLLSAKIQNLKSEVIPALIEDGYQKWIDPNWSDFDRDNSLFAGHQAA